MNKDEFASIMLKFAENIIEANPWLEKAPFQEQNNFLAIFAYSMMVVLDRDPECVAVLSCIKGFTTTAMMPRVSNKDAAKIYRQCAWQQEHGIEIKVP